jgi:birA, biotin-[acetyl-CoA-carboxylase] ligase region
MKSPLDRDAISGAGVVGSRIAVFQETESTNDVAAHAAAGGEPEGFVAFTETQTRGRGQFGRRWESRAGLGLWFSILLRPQWPTGKLTEMTPLVAVAVARAVADLTGRVVRIKPPNDIFCGGRKLAGILSEAKTGVSMHVVVGIGLNVNHTVADFPPELRQTATSMRIETDQTWTREEVATAVLRSIGTLYDPASPPGEEVARAYAELSHGPVCDNLCG